MKITICIPTHNRPLLFTRAINSVLSAPCDHTVEIRVNNDTNDITEIHSDLYDIQYSYIKSSNLSDIYKHLYEGATGEYVYFLEDDDYIHPSFFNNVGVSYDIYYMLYTSCDHISYYGPVEARRRQKLNDSLKEVHDHKTFISKYDDQYFQLGQIFFRKDKLIDFPRGNDIKNDYKLFSSCFKDVTTIKYIDKQLWVQTTDGGDNISFDTLNNDARFN